jgi:hypothetical protein
MARQSLIPLVAACVLALAACGGGGDSGGGGGNGNGGNGNVDTSSTLYQAAYGVCSSASPEQIKQDYRTTSTDPADIAHDVAVNLAGGNPDDQPNAEAGCKDGLEAYKSGG